MGDVGNGDDSYHNGAFYLAANFGFFASFKPRGDQPERPQQSVPFQFGTPDAYDYYLRMGPLANAKPIKEQPLLGRSAAASQLRRILAIPRPRAPHEEREAGGADGRRLVRCGGSCRTAQAVPRTSRRTARRRRPRWSWDRGATAAGLAQRPTTFGNLNFSHRRPASSIASRSNCRSSSDHLKGKARRLERPEAWLFETGTNRWRKFASWPPAEAKAASALPGRRGQALLHPANRRRLRRVHQRPGASGSCNFGEIGSRHARRLHDLRPALRLQAARRADLHDRTARPRRHHRRTRHTRAARRHQRHRFRFRRQAHRRLSRRLSGSRPNPKVHMGGYQQLVRGEPFRGKFRNSIAEAGAFRAGKSRQDRILDAGHLPYLPPRPPHHGADPELVVSR